MGSETVGLLVVVGVIVAVLALYLITIGLALTRLNRTLAAIVGGLTIIRDRSAPVGAVLGDIVTDVDAIEVNLDALLGAVGGAPATAVVSTMGEAVAQARGETGRRGQKAPVAPPAPADMEEAVARAREAAPAPDGEEEFDLAMAGAAGPAGPPTVSPAVRATTRTPRPVAQMTSRPRPKKRSKRSRVPVLETSPSASGSSGRSAGRRKQLAIGSGAAGNGAGNSSMKEAVARAREKASVH